MNKILFLGSFSQQAKVLFEQRLPEGFENIGFYSAEQAPLEDAQYIICRSQVVDEELLKKAKNLCMIQKWGAGYDKIDIKAAADLRIPVAVCLGTNAVPVSEMALALMLAVYRNLLWMRDDLRAGTADRNVYIADSYTLNGKRVGILGIGNIGRRVASLVQAFGAQVVYYDACRLPKEQEKLLGITYKELNELYAQSDIVSLHLPLTETTRGMIDRSVFQKMKSTAVLINTARGAIVNQDDLIWALREKQIAGAGLDTVVTEPLAADSPLLQMNKVVVTAHCGGNTADNDIVMVDHCYNNLQLFAKGDQRVKKEIVNWDLIWQG